jgi:hypothetical protein
MKFKSGKLFPALKSYHNLLIIQRRINHSSEKKIVHSRQSFRSLLSLMLIFFICSFRLNAQEIKKTAVFPESSSKVVLRIKGLGDEKTASVLEGIFKDHPQKIISYSIDKKNNSATVILSDKLQPVDLLELLESQGIHAGYINENKEYVGLDEEGELAEPINITK